jgi:hypothetical protein
VRLFAISIRAFLLFKPRDEISFKGEGCDTPSVTIVATVFCSASTVSSSMYLGLKCKFEFNPCL